MAELALHLQVQTQSCHDEIGRIGAELRAILPRCAADLSRLNVGIGNIQDDAKNLLEAHLKSSLSHVPNAEVDSSEGAGREDGEESNPDHDEKENQDLPDHTKGMEEDNEAMTPLETLETLSTLHALQQNLTKTKKVLTAASTYNHTLQKIPSLLTPTTLNQGVQALLDLENGARALTGMPGKSQRNEEITEIRNQILTLLKPVLLHALNKVESRLGPLQTCVGMYQSLNKVESLMEEYVKSRPATVHKLWFDFRKSRNSGATGASRDSMDATGIDGEDAGGDHDMGGEDDLEFYTENDTGDEGFTGTVTTRSGHGTGKGTSRSEPNASDPGKAFGDWLPTWYEAVLLLLSEERRRAHAVFGTDLAPEVMVKVLNECFRPILSSFKNRLEAICPADGVSRGSDQSFECICRAYESTLQFLSVAYEQMVDFESNSSSGVSSDDKAQGHGGDAADIEGGAPSRTKTPVQLHVMARSIFISVASPFSLYQNNFAKLEAHHSGMTARIVSSDIHNAVSGRILALSNMQESAERLAGLAPFMFPLAQGTKICC